MTLVVPAPLAPPGIICATVKPCSMGGNWTAHLIDDSLTVVHGVHVIDWDDDGRDEILTASFEGVHLFDAASGQHL